ncbi:MAG: hypothetical protein ACR2LS_10955 [Thermomicrobiales bacterium]
MREQQPGEPEITDEAVGQRAPHDDGKPDGFMRYIGTQLGMWVFVAILFVIGVIAIVVYANVY